jgi:predicted phage terminase large subunit-like protein
MSRAAPSREQKQSALVQQERLVKARLARENLLDFIQFTMPDPDAPDDVERSAYHAARPHRAICEAVQTFVEGGYPGYDILILTVPPRHGKSEIVSRRLPAWYSGRYPRQNVVVASYGDEFAADFGAEVRRIVGMQQFRQIFPDYSLVRGGTAKDRLNTKDGGLMFFVGRGAGLTGRGAHLLICDDLIKDDKEAASKPIRDQAWSWLTRVAMTRRMGAKRMILTFTRWHADDPIGRLTDPENEHYKVEIARKIKVINLPALAEEEDALGRKPGEALWPDGPDKFDETFLGDFKIIDPIGFSSLYQQRPTVEDGILFRRENIRYYTRDQLPTNLRIYAASDHAVTTNQRSDSTCMGKCGVDEEGNIWLLPDLFWKKATTNVVVEAMLAMGGGAQPPLIWWAEKGHISKSIGPFLRQRMAETSTYFNLVEVTPAGDKEQRAQAISAKMALGRVYLPAEAWWTDKAVEQMLAFPNGTHDDFVDFIAYLGLGLRVQIKASTPRAEAKEPHFGTIGWVKRQQKYDDREARRLRLGGF